MNPPELLEEDYRSRPELAAYYSDRKLMVRNVALIGLCQLGSGFAGIVAGPLIILELLELGVRENIQATISSVNGFALSFLVMWFSWMSDHTVSKMGRRKPYLFASAPFLIFPMMAFPFLAESHWVPLLIGLQIVKMLALDMKMSTFPLLSIDCVPRNLLARANSVLLVAGGIMGFLAMRYTKNLILVADWFPYVLGGSVMLLTTATAWFIKEPPINHPATEPFRPWSTFKTIGKDKRIFWLILGVAMINGFLNMNNQWVWFWSKETLNLQREDIFEALSWAHLINIVLAYPIGMIIDRWGGFRIVVMLWIGQVMCFAWAMNVTDKMGLIVLSLATTMIAPLYAAADIMVYKSADPKDVGSMTSSSACIRNMYNALLSLVAGWAIFLFSHNFRIGFIMGIVMSTVGLAMFFIHRRKMQQKPLSSPDSAGILGKSNAAGTAGIG